MSADRERIARMHRLRQTLESAGWRDIREEIGRRLDAARERLEHRMEKKPETLSSKTAMRDGLERRILTDLLDWIEEEVQLGEASEKVLERNDLTRQPQPGPARTGNP